LTIYTNVPLLDQGYITTLFLMNSTIQDDPGSSCRNILPRSYHLIPSLLLFNTTSTEKTSYQSNRFFYLIATNSLTIYYKVPALCLPYSTHVLLPSSVSQDHPGPSCRLISHRTYHPTYCLKKQIKYISSNNKHIEVERRHCLM